MFIFEVLVLVTIVMKLASVHPAQSQSRGGILVVYQRDIGTTRIHFGPTKVELEDKITVVLLLLLLLLLILDQQREQFAPIFQGQLSLRAGSYAAQAYWHGVGRVAIFRKTILAPLR
jgi:hypothetical protein